MYLVKGRYLAKIVFQRRQYFLGTYPSVEEAAEARKKAEEAIHGEVISFYEKWSEKAAADPVWAKDNPIKISVSKVPMLNCACSCSRTCNCDSRTRS